MTAPPMTLWAQGALTNDSVLRLSSFGVPESTLIAEIRRVPTKFDVSPEALERLRAAGVSERVLEAMREAAASSAPVRAISGATWTRLGFAVAEGAVGDDRVPTVVDLLPRGAGASVGVQRGDVLTHVNGDRVRSALDALRRIQDAPRPQTTRLTVLRRGGEVLIAIPPADSGDITPPAAWATVAPGRNASPVTTAVAVDASALAGSTSGGRAPPSPASVPVDLAIRFVPADPSPRTIVSVALIDGGAVVREAVVSVDGQTVHAAFVGPAHEVPTGRRYLVEVATALGRRPVATLDLREATVAVTMTVDAPGRW